MNPKPLRLHAQTIMQQAALAIIISIIGLMIGWLAAFPGLYRLLIAITLFACLLAVALRKPVMALMLVIALLPFTGLIRRLLIPIAGWTSFDPLLLVAPVLVLLLGAHWFMKRWILDREPIGADTRLFLCVLLFLLLSVVQIINPLQGSLLVGVGGILYFIVPLFWMVLGREYFNLTHMRILYAMVYMIGVVAAIYGIIQTHVGFAPFEYMWVELGGYAALWVGDSLRAFSVFTSAQEFSCFLSISFVIGWACLLRARLISKILCGLSLPVLGYAMFMVGSRTPVILTLLSITVITLLRFRSYWAKLLVIIVAIAFGFIGMRMLDSFAQSENDFLVHQANGLINPLDEEHSTLTLHWGYFLQGIMKGFQVPIGHGLGSSTQAASTLGGKGNNTEYDISDIMVSHGIIGGVLYLLIMITIFRLLFALPRHEPLHIALVGILLATIGFWLIGELTSVAAVLWVSIGYMDKVMKHHRWNALKRHLNKSYASQIGMNR